MNYSIINLNYARHKAQKAFEHLQDEVRAAKQIQTQTGCTWTDALKAAHDALRHKEIQ